MQREFLFHLNEFIYFDDITGQKFALMEEKVVLSTVLRNFHIGSLDKRDDLVVLGQLILRPRDGIRLRLIPRRR